jgi:hypothetical protein
MNRIVVIESPYAGDVDLNVHYARLCVKDCLNRGEAAYASHLFFTQDHILDDTVPEERQLGMEAGKLIEETLFAPVVVYQDLGISKGMEWGIQKAKEQGREIEYRKLEGWKQVEDTFKRGQVKKRSYESSIQADRLKGWKR